MQYTVPHLVYLGHVGEAVHEDTGAGEHQVVRSLDRANGTVAIYFLAIAHNIFLLPANVCAIAWAPATQLTEPNKVSSINLIRNLCKAINVRDFFVAIIFLAR